MMKFVIFDRHVLYFTILFSICFNNKETKINDNI